jgi:hypothetical protein
MGVVIGICVKYPGVQLELTSLILILYPYCTLHGTAWS